MISADSVSFRALTAAKVGKWVSSGAVATGAVGRGAVGGDVGGGDAKMGGQGLLVLADAQKVTGCVAGDEVIDVLGIGIEPGGMAGVKLGELARDMKSGGSSG